MSATENLQDSEIKQLNDMERFLSYQQTWLFHQFITCSERIIGLFCGNQAFKTSASSYQYVMRVLGHHPVPENNLLYFECQSRACPNKHRYRKVPADMVCQKCGDKIGKFSAHKFTIATRPKDNVCPHCQTQVIEHIRQSRIIRFASETLPQEKENTGEDGRSAEIKNTIYPELKKWLPPFLIKRDITFRNPSMAITDPFGRGDIIFEFNSYNQPTQAGAGVQRAAIYCDEEPPIDFWNEQKPRLLAENGDLILGLTPANQMSYTFDEVYEKAKIYYRTDAIVAFTGKPKIEKTDSKVSIAVFQAATDDNPTLDKATIDRMFDSYDDPDVIATRRFGIHKQSTGRIFDFDYKTHFISREKWFPEGRIFPSYVHARLMDYHESTPLAISFIALSPEDEAFVWLEWNPSPEKYVTVEICNQIALMSKDYKFALNLMDPLGTKTQTNTGTSVLDDFNHHFWQLKKDGICTGGFWEGWDTKSTKGRDIIRMRLKNSKQVQKPFNNKVAKDGREQYLPTLWVLDSCKLTAQSLKNWRKDEKGEPEQKFSHFCTALEAIFKDIRFRPRRGEYEREKSKRELGLFQGARR